MDDKANVVAPNQSNGLRLFLQFSHALYNTTLYCLHLASSPTLNFLRSCVVDFPLPTTSTITSLQYSPS